MDYEKKYKEALERAREFVSKDNVEVSEYIFPELVESEDERIRKALIQGFNECLDSSSYPKNAQKYWHGIAIEDIFAWLEKQGEQIPADKEGSKFKNGDWITDGNITIQIEAIKNDCYLYCGDCVLYSTKTADKVYHLWTIEDAKPGDVLYSPCCKLLWIYKDDNSCYVGHNLSYSENCVVVNSSICIPSDACPATKEQRDTLMKAMVNAGYTFDFEKKELNKIKKNDYEPDALIEESYQQQADDLIDMVTEKSAWSEEDENQCINTIELVKNANDCAGILDKETALNWLKTLKQRCTWKPSDEQIEILDTVLTNESMDDNIARILRELREQLKKLKA